MGNFKNKYHIYMKITTDYIYILSFIAFMIGLIYKKSQFIEPFTACTQATDCITCVGADTQRASGDGRKCYWNSRQQICGSFKDQGYSSTCDSGRTGTRTHRWWITAT